MKFQTIEDKKLFLIEIGKVSLLETIDDTWEPTEELMEMYVQKRKELVPKLRDFRRSQAAKGSWRSNRYKFMKGIRRFHSSTKGKRMHRALGDFLATRESFIDATPFHPGIFEALKAISSLKTHAFIELEYYQPVDEYIEFTEMVEQLIPLVARVDESFIKGQASLQKDDLEFLYRMVEEKELLLAYSRKLNQPYEELQPYWENCKLKLEESGTTEDHETFYSDLVKKLEDKFST